jgi:hypothetical protein
VKKNRNISNNRKKKFMAISVRGNIDFLPEIHRNRYTRFMRKQMNIAETPSTIIVSFRKGNCLSASVEPITGFVASRHWKYQKNKKAILHISVNWLRNLMDFIDDYC